MKIKNNNYKTILFLGRDLSNSSVRLRHINYFNLWKEYNYYPIFYRYRKSKNIISLIKLLFKLKKTDILVIIRKTMPAWYLYLIRLFAKKIIFDFDDAIFYKPNGNYSKKRLARFTNMINKADIIWTGNNYLKNFTIDIIKTKNTLNENKFKYNYISKIKTIPTAIDYDKYLNTISNIETLLSKKNNTQDIYIDLVWIGSKSTSKLLKPIIPILNNININKPYKIRLKNISDIILEYPEFKNIKIINIPWSENTEIQELYNADIGIAPMNDNNWNKGKCAFKVLQYMASGLPVLTSPVGMNKELIINNINGFRITQDSDWEKYINLLAIDKFENNKKLINQMSENNKKTIVDLYTNKIIFSNMLNSIF